MAGSWAQVWSNYACAVTETAAEAMSTGTLSPGEIITDSFALSMEAARTICECCKDLVQTCLTNASAAAHSVIYFEIDQQSQCTTGMPIGNVALADANKLNFQDLVSDGSLIPAAHVKAIPDQADGFVYVYLENLTQLQPLPLGLYKGDVLLSGNPVTTISVLVVNEISFM
jgi:hypothetical protein